MDSSSQDTGSAEHAEETGMDEFELVDSPPVSAMDKKSMATTAPLDQVLPQVDLDELSMSLNQPLLPARSIAFRVLFMGHRISQRQKSMILKKIGEGIAAIPSSSGGARRIPDGTPQHFQEKTHNVVILDAFNPEPVETYEDNGLHVIEADFTWGSDSVTTAADVDEEELDAYIKYHYYKSSSSSSRRPNSSESAMNHKGIDLVIYLFSTTSAVYDKIVERDMRSLARLSALGVYTWPILAVRLSRSSHEQQRPPGSRNNSSSRPPTRTSYRRAMSPTSVSPTPSSSFIARGRILSGLGGVSGSSISELFQQQQQQEDESQCELAALQMALSEQLSKYPIKKVDVSGINPERPRFAAAAAATTTTTAGGGGTALTESLAPGIFLTTDQFASIDQKDMCRILSSCQTTITTTLENQRASWLSRWLLSSRLSKMLLPSFLLYDGGFSQRAILCLLLAGVLASTTFFRRSMQPLETHIAHPDLTQATVKLDPMWEVPDEYSLRHFFVVELTPLVHNLNKNTLWSNEDIKIKLNTSSAITQQQEYAMSYIPGTRFKYSADVPSPCLLNSEEDFSASVEWTLYHSSTVLSIDRVTLYVDICKSVDQGRYEIQEYTPAQFADTKKRMAVYTPPSWYEEQWMQLIFHIKQYFKQLRKHLRRYF